MIAVLSPGQGAQTPGMLSPWLELNGVAEQLAHFSELAQLDLTRLGTTAGADEIVDTAITQPLIVAAGLIAAGQLGLGALPPHSVLSAGHSIGEVTAAAVADVLTDEQAMRFAARRGREMAAACELAPTTMAAALGGEPEAVIAAIVAAGLTPANRNGAGQIVVAGATEAVEKLIANPPAGVRFRALKVAGAFHTRFMAPAEENLRAVAAELTVADPRQLLLSNADGTTVEDGRTVLARLVAQVTRPVRWDLCQDTMRAVGVTTVIELTPAKTLTGIAKRELPGARPIAIRTPDDLAAAREALAEVSTPAAPPEQVQAPAQGIFTRVQRLAEGSTVLAGCRIGTVRTHHDEVAVVAPATGVLREWLRNDGDVLGAAGLPVARMA
ncbi:MAG TPA: ACP S-malonyltransferase [Jatrophihabitans sp.]|nr:ACP S-malonyltransferase [Jatrophihabitans sp.]